MPINCPNCGVFITADTVHCGNCGARIPDRTLIPQTVSTQTIQTNVPETYRRKKSHWKAITAIIIFFLVILILVPEGFSEYSAAKSLTESVSGVGVQNIGVFSASITLTVNFANPTSGTTPPFSADFNVYLNGNNIGTGNLLLTTVKPASSTYQTVIFTVYFTSVASSLINAVGNGSLSLVVSGTINAQIFGIIPSNTSFRMCANVNSGNSNYIGLIAC